MAKQYFLRFLIKNQINDLVFEVRSSQCDRLRDLFDSFNSDHTDFRFFVFESLDGRTIAINLADMQAVRYLWDPSEYPSDLLHDSGTIDICLRGRESILKENTENPDQLFAVFAALETGLELESFPKFLDEDGEELQLNAKEIVWISVPSLLMSEGYKLIMTND